jgi:hypothetical protein
VFTSFLQSNLRTINDIWDSNNTNFKSCHDIYNLLIDRRNCISEFSKIKKEIPQISFIVRKLLCRNEVNPNGLFLKVIEELQNILSFLR